MARAAAVALAIASGAALAPLAIPLLPVERYVGYARALHLAPETHERQAMGALPQHFADMFGWDELAAEVARVYHSLPEGERRHCVVFGQNYGEAGAVTVLGRRMSVPPALSGHNSFWFWGPGRDDPSAVVIIVGGDAEDHEQMFRSVERVGVTTSRYAMPYEQDLPIYVGRGLREPLTRIWPRVRMFI